MNIILSKEGCAKHNLSIGEALLLLIYCNKININVEHKSLVEKGLVTKIYNNDNSEELGWRVTRNGMELIDAIIVDSTKSDDEPLLEIAKELRKIFPKGKKDGTNRYWTEGEALIVRRLKLFFKKYGNFTKDQILDAANTYVKSFNGNYKSMRTLKYFILKEAIGASNEVESSSDLLTYIENSEQVTNDDRDWTSTLI